MTKKDDKKFIVLDREKGGHVKRGVLDDSRIMLIEDIYEAREWFKKLAEEESKDKDGFFEKYFKIKVGSNGKFLGNQHFTDGNVIKKDIYYAWKYKFLQLEDLTEYEMAMYVFGDVESWEKLKKNSKPLRKFLEEWKRELEIIIKGKAFKRIVKDAKKNVSSAKYILEGKYKPFIEGLNKKDNEKQNEKAAKLAFFSDESLFEDIKEIYTEQEERSIN